MANYNPYINYNYNPYLQQQQNIQPQIQNGGFVSVRSEAEAMNYPVALGTSVTFRDETAPYIYTKTTGFSQLDRPKFEKFKLIKENTQNDGATVEATPVIEYAEKSEIEAVKADIAALRKMIEVTDNE